MKIILLGFLLLVCVNLASAQFIFIHPKGERALSPLKDIKTEYVDISNKGEPCGDSFLFEIVVNSQGTYDKIVSFDLTRAAGD
jgi:hypothetical protein